jgi:hypothetical protein
METTATTKERVFAFTASHTGGEIMGLFNYVDFKENCPVCNQPGIKCEVAHG